MDALSILDDLIADEAKTISKMAVAFPQDFDRLNAGTGAGIRLQTLVDARNHIRTKLAQELEAEALKIAMWGAGLVLPPLDDDEGRATVEES